jgi:hypothetical protein
VNAVDLKNPLNYQPIGDADFYLSLTELGEELRGGIMHRRDLVFGNPSIEQIARDYTDILISALS